MNETEQVVQGSGATQEGAGGSLSVLGGSAGAVLSILQGGGGGAPVVPKPLSQPILIMPEVRVAGTSHVDDIDEIAEALHEGDRLSFRRQADNPYDEWAIRVLDGDGREMGWFPADKNEVPARLMDGGKELFGKVVSMELAGSWHKIGMAVYLDD